MWEEVHRRPHAAVIPQAEELVDALGGFCGPSYVSQQSSARNEGSGDARLTVTALGRKIARCHKEKVDLLLGLLDLGADLVDVLEER